METIEEPFEPGSFGWVYSKFGYPIPPGLAVGTLVKIMAVRGNGAADLMPSIADVVTADARSFTIDVGRLEMRKRYRFAGDNRLYSEKHPRVQKYLLWQAKDKADEIAKLQKEHDYLHWVATRSRPEHMVFTLDPTKRANDLNWDEEDCPR